MGPAGQELRRTEFTMEQMISTVEHLYEELGATARAGAPAGRPEGGGSSRASAPLAPVEDDWRRLADLRGATAS